MVLLCCCCCAMHARQRRHQTRWQPGQAGLGCMVWATMQMQGPNHCRGITAFMPAMQMHSAQAGHTCLSASCGEEGGRRHEGNLADARTQPNNVRPPQKIVEGSARGQCPAVLYEREGSRGQQDCGRAEKKGGQKQQEEGRAERGNQEEVAAGEKESS